MNVSLIDAGPLLAIDIGAVKTRALLFDVVENRFHFVAQGIAPTTASAPIFDVSEGVRMSLDQLQEITGRIFMGTDEQLVIPSQPNGNGVDAVVATLAVGPPLRIALAGLLEHISLSAGQHLTETTYGEIVTTISLNDRRKEEQKIDAVLHARPDVVIVTGGTQGGASQSVMNLVESVGLASYLMPEETRPTVLFAGNQELTGKVKELLGKLVTLHTASNVRPALMSEDLKPAQAELAKIYTDLQVKKIAGIQELKSWSLEHIQPRPFAFGRVVNFLSRIYDPHKGVLGVGIENSAAVMAAAFAGKLSLGVYPELGLGTNPNELLKHISVEQIGQWLLFELPNSYIQDYLQNQFINPNNLPVRREDLAIRQAMMRETLQAGIRRLAARMPAKQLAKSNGYLPWFEPIIARGEAFAHIPTHGQAMLILLDGLQPTGITTIVLDQNDISPSLGMAAEINPALSVQVLESSAFVNLGTVISPLGNARSGTPILRMKITFEETGNTMRAEVKAGSLEVIPLPMGQSAQIELQPLHRFDVGLGGPGKGGPMRVLGGAVGLVIDARGRPIRLPAVPENRRETLKRWLWRLGG